MADEVYVDYHDGGYWIKGSRVSLDSIVYAFRQGKTAEAIAQSFPVVSLENIRGGIAFYLSHRDQIDTYLEKGELEFDAMRQAAVRANPDLYKKFSNARGQSQPS